MEQFWEMIQVALGSVFPLDCYRDSSAEGHDLGL